MKRTPLTAMLTLAAVLASSARAVGLRREIELLDVDVEPRRRRPRTTPGTTTTTKHGH